MREIKFRAWDGEKWIYLNISNPSINFNKEWNTWVEEIVKKGRSIYQYTGLKANGKEIYEGDMIKISDSDMEYFPEDGEDFIVKWFKDCCGFWIWHIESNRWWDGDMNPFSYEPEIEIIGNIYENPELIK